MKHYMCMKHFLHELLMIWFHQQRYTEGLLYLQDTVSRLQPTILNCRSTL